MSFNSETWEWFKTAPLPVVLSICRSSFTILGTYAYSLDQAQQKHIAEEKASVAVAAEQARTAAETAKRVENKIDKLTEVLQAVAIEQAVAKAEKKKEKK